MGALFAKLSQPLSVLTKASPQMQDAQNLYQILLGQSRQTQFYGPGRIPDSYDGRIDFLTLHIAIVMKILRIFDQDGRLLSQALFDAMKDDFEIALREEGLSDTGVARRIKPIIGLFYARLKAYDQALDLQAVQDMQEKTDLYHILKQGVLGQSERDFIDHVSRYSHDFYAKLLQVPFADIAQGRFEFPKVSALL